jgi:sarcosine oxidase subunit alpha
MQMLELTVNDKTISVDEGSTVAAAIFASDAENFRRSISAEPRFPLCGMGICYECRVTIDSIKHQKSCQILAQAGMKIETDE